MISQVKADLAAISANRQTLRPFYEMNYVLVPPGQPRVAVEFFENPDESDLDGGEDPVGRYPIPSVMPIEGWPREVSGLTLEDWQIDIDHDGGDRHAIIVQPATGDLWEMWQAKRTGSNWQAACGAKFNLGSHASRPLSWTSADTAGLQMFPALVRYDEFCAAKSRRPAAVVARTRRACIYPATHYASSSTTASRPAMGQRFRLKAGFIVPATWTIHEKAVCYALKKYGALIADNGNFFFGLGLARPALPVECLRSSPHDRRRSIRGHRNDRAHGGAASTEPARRRCGTRSGRALRIARVSRRHGHGFATGGDSLGQVLRSG